MNPQLIIIHGGDTFETYEEYLSSLKSTEIDLEYLRKVSWKINLGKALGKEFDVLNPQMPNKLNAKYLEWRIWFDKMVPLFGKEVIFVGHSLGAIFLAKYLSENTYTNKILATFLIAAPFDDADADYTLADFALPKSLVKFEKQGGKITFYHSKDDPVVPFVDLEKYKKAVPSAHIRIFEDKGHFGQEDFPELAEEIKKIII